jgi:hypothetical protein
VRARQPERFVIIGPSQWNNLQHLPHLDLPADDRRLIVTFHFYEPFSFTHQGASWVRGADAWLGNRWAGTPEETARIEHELEVAARWAREHDRPLFCGEFGAFSRADHGLPRALDLLRRAGPGGTRHLVGLLGVRLRLRGVGSADARVARTAAQGSAALTRAAPSALQCRLAGRRQMPTMTAVHVCLDIQSAITQRAGVGRYTKLLVEHLAVHPPADTSLGLFYFDFQRKGVPVRARPERDPAGLPMDARAAIVTDGVEDHVRGRPSTGSRARPMCTTSPTSSARP